MNSDSKLDSEEEQQLKTAIEKGIAWLLHNQYADGSWGDSRQTGSVPFTAYAIDALMKAKLIKSPQEILANPDNITIVKVIDSSIRRALNDSQKSRRRKELLWNFVWSIVGAILGVAMTIIFNLFIYSV